MADILLEAQPKEGRFDRFRRLMGWKNNWHFVIEMALVVLIVCVAAYSVLYDIPDTDKARICYSYYIGLDKNSEIGQAYDKLHNKSMIITGVDQWAELANATK